MLRSRLPKRRGYSNLLCTSVHICSDLVRRSSASLPLLQHRHLPGPLPSAAHYSMAHTKHEAQPLRRSARIASKPKPPPGPPSICEPCRKGPFAAQLGLFHPEGYSYLVWRSQIKQRASSGCPWCKFLLDNMFPYLRSDKAKPPRRVEVSLEFKQEYWYTPISAQILQVEVAFPSATCIHRFKRLTTSSGGSSNHTQRT